MPPAEYDAKVGGVPGEEHLRVEGLVGGDRDESQSIVNVRSCYIYLLPYPFPCRACCDPYANDPLRLRVWMYTMLVFR